MSSCWDREILPKVQEPRAQTPGCGCCSTGVVTVGRRDNGWVLTAFKPGALGQPEDVSTG